MIAQLPATAGFRSGVSAEPRMLAVKLQLAQVLGCGGRFLGNGEDELPVLPGLWLPG